MIEKFHKTLLQNIGPSWIPTAKECLPEGHPYPTIGHYKIIITFVRNSST